MCSLLSADVLAQGKRKGRLISRSGKEVGIILEQLRPSAGETGDIIEQILEKENQYGGHTWHRAYEPSRPNS